MKLYRFYNNPTITARRNVDWRGREWEFSVEGSFHTGGEEQVAHVTMDRGEALRLRRNLNALLKATAPPRKARA